MMEREPLGNLTQKELLILMNERIVRIDVKVTEYEKDILALKLKMTELQTKIAVWASLVGFGAGALANIISQLIK